MSFRVAFRILSVPFASINPGGAKKWGTRPLATFAIQQRQESEDVLTRHDVSPSLDGRTSCLRTGSSWPHASVPRGAGGHVGVSSIIVMGGRSWDSCSPLHVAGMDQGSHSHHGRGRHSRRICSAAFTSCSAKRSTKIKLQLQLTVLNCERIYILVR